MVTARTVCWGVATVVVGAAVGWALGVAFGWFVFKQPL